MRGTVQGTVAVLLQEGDWKEAWQLALRTWRAVQGKKCQSHAERPESRAPSHRKELQAAEELRQSYMLGGGRAASAAGKQPSRGVQPRQCDCVPQGWPRPQGLPWLLNSLPTPKSCDPRAFWCLCSLWGSSEIDFVKVLCKHLTVLQMYCYYFPITLEDLCSVLIDIFSTYLQSLFNFIQISDL